MFSCIFGAIRSKSEWIFSNSLGRHICGSILPNKVSLASNSSRRLCITVLCHSFDRRAATQALMHFSFRKEEDSHLYKVPLMCH